jgi:hypothetical protein
MLYDSASNPRLHCLYICPVANVLVHAAAPPSFRASSAATVTPLSHTASRTIGVLVLDTPPPTRSGTGDEEASQRGRCSSGGSARRRRSGLNTGQ